MTSEPQIEPSIDQPANPLPTTRDLAQVMLTLAEHVEHIEHQHSRLVQWADQVESNVERLSDSQGLYVGNQQAIEETMQRLTYNLEHMAKIQTRLVETVDQLSGQLSSTSAAVERLERLVDYLIRRDAAHPPEAGE